MLTMQLREFQEGHVLRFGTCLAGATAYEGPLRAALAAERMYVARTCTCCSICTSIGDHVFARPNGELTLCKIILHVWVDPPLAEAKSAHVAIAEAFSQQGMGYVHRVGQVIVSVEDIVAATTWAPKDDGSIRLLKPPVLEYGL